MPDFPSTDAITPLFISSMGEFSGFSSTQAGPAVASSRTNPSANLALYIPLTIPFYYNVKRMWWANGATAAANADIGLYTPGQARIFGAGSTAQSGTSNIQYVTPGTDLWLSPGEYYLAIVFSGTTGAFSGGPGTVISNKKAGIYQQATALPLPSAATFASCSTGTFVPFCGITKTASGF